MCWHDPEDVKNGLARDLIPRWRSFRTTYGFVLTSTQTYSERGWTGQLVRERDCDKLNHY